MAHNEIMLFCVPQTRDENFFLIAEMESPNVQILLKESIDIKGVYGITKTSDELLLHLDKPQKFIDALNDFVIACD